MEPQMDLARVGRASQRSKGKSQESKPSACGSWCEHDGLRTEAGIGTTVAETTLLHDCSTDKHGLSCTVESGPAAEPEPGERKSGHSRFIRFVASWLSISGLGETPEPTLSHEITKDTKLMGAGRLWPFHPVSCLRGSQFRNQGETRSWHAALRGCIILSH